MSILIKGMEMPKYGIIGVFISSDRNVYDSMDNIIGTIVPVPPHGRLIDADKLFKWIKAECNPYGAPTIGYEDGLKVLDMVDRCSTIIEAEE